MKFLLFIAPNNYRDETLAMVKTFFNRWHVEYQVTSYSNKECIGSHGAVTKPDVNAGKIVSSDYDGIILLDGNGLEEYKLFEYRPLLDVIMHFDEKGKVIGAVGNAIKIIARANVIKEKKISTPDNSEIKRLVLLFHGVPSEESIEFSGNVITIKDYSGLEGPMQQMLQHMNIM